MNFCRVRNTTSTGVNSSTLVTWKPLKSLTFAVSYSTMWTSYLRAHSTPMAVLKSPDTCVLLSIPLDTCMCCLYHCLALKVTRYVNSFFLWRNMFISILFINIDYLPATRQLLKYDCQFGYLLPNRWGEE